MDLISLSKLFSEILDYKVYAINFPEYREGTYTKIEITSGVQEAGGVADFNIQFMVKSEHPSKSEGAVLNILNKLDMVTNKDFAEGTYQLILIKSISPQPYYVGETENGEFIFSADFRLLVSRL